ncbi:MAG: mechanosensitive ion channel [Myxococcales bacterium]|nr:mechanosensitive ion channel [Myxococcales bacterium]MCB9579140.1 mechanosensitive ion channel [Polyangiaceae bacterium]
MQTDVVKTGQSVLNAKLFDIGNTPISLMTLATMILVVFAAYLLSRILQATAKRALKRRGLSVDSGGLGVVGRLMHYAIMLVGVGVALQTGGIALGALFAAGAVFAVGFGFAMQNIAQNFVSGVILLVERTIKPGDIIEVNDTMVRVESMGIRATLARTLDEEDLIVPNSALVQGTVKNFSLRDAVYRLRVPVGVTYSSDMAQVRRVLEGVGESFARRDATFAPQVMLTDFGASSVDWEISVWIKDPWTRRQVAGQLREAVWNALKKEDIVIAFPQMDVHLDPPVMASLSQLAGQRALSS